MRERGGTAWLRTAVVDIGSNSIHLLVADRRPAPTASGVAVRRVVSPATLLALGRAVAERGEIDDDAAAELRRVVTRQVRQAEREGARAIHVAATAAVRLAANGAARMATLAEDAGIPVRVLTPAREAELAFLGVSDMLHPTAEQLVIDGGGASTEVVLSQGRRCHGVASLPVGGSLLSADHADPPTPADVHRLRWRIRAALAAAPAGAPLAAVATGGCARKLPVVLDRPSGSRMDRAALSSALEVLRTLPSATVARRTGLPRRRTQSLLAGALILEAVLEHYGLSGYRTVSRGLREGIVIAAATEPESWWVDAADLLRRRRRAGSRAA